MGAIHGSGSDNQTIRLETGRYQGIPEDLFSGAHDFHTHFYELPSEIQLQRLLSSPFFAKTCCHINRRHSFNVYKYLALTAACPPRIAYVHYSSDALIINFIRNAVLLIISMARAALQFDLFFFF